MTKVAAGFVIFRKVCGGNIEYLLLQTSYGIHHWTPPKGHVDPGETEMITALRETQEESGLIQSDLKIFENSKKTLYYNVNNIPKIVVYWLAELINSNAVVKLSEEHQDYKWLNIDDACKYAQFTDFQKMLLDFNKYITDELTCISAK